MNFTHSYYPSQGDGSTTPAGDSQFSDTVKAIGTSPYLSDPVVQLSDAATCPICLPAE
jgi:hypothetical protein